MERGPNHLADKEVCPSNSDPGGPPSKCGLDPAQEDEDKVMVQDQGNDTYTQVHQSKSYQKHSPLKNQGVLVQGDQVLNCPSISSAKVPSILCKTNSNNDVSQNIDLPLPGMGRELSYHNTHIENQGINGNIKGKSLSSDTNNPPNYIGEEQPGDGGDSELGPRIKTKLGNKTNIKIGTHCKEIQKGHLGHLGHLVNQEEMMETISTGDHLHLEPDDNQYKNLLNLNFSLKGTQKENEEKGARISGGSGDEPVLQGDPGEQNKMMPKPIHPEREKPANKKDNCDRNSQTLNAPGTPLHLRSSPASNFWKEVNLQQPLKKQTRKPRKKQVESGSKSKGTESGLRQTKLELGKFKRLRVTRLHTVEGANSNSQGETPVEARSQLMDREEHL